MAVTKLDQTRHPRTFVFNTLSSSELGPVSPGAGVANTTIQGGLLLPWRYKIAKVSVFCTALDNIGGTSSFNLVVGNGTYETIGNGGSNTITVAGTWATSDIINATINGILSTFTVGATSTVTAVAAGLIAAINANTATNGTLNAGKPLNSYVNATAVAGAITLTTPNGDTNAYTLTTTKTSTSGTTTAGGATFTAGTATTGLVQGTNDNSYDSGSASVGYATNIAVAGTAVFAADIPFSLGNPYVEANGTGWNALAVATGGYGHFVPLDPLGNPLWDVVYPRTLPLTLRVTTQATVGSISNLVVAVSVEPQTLYPNYFDAANPTNYPYPGKTW